MLAATLITFRETLEAALVVGIILTFLAKIKQQWFSRFVWCGVGAGVLASVALAVLLELFFGGLSGKTEGIFEGALLFVTAGFLTWMILWVHRQQDVVGKMKEKVAVHVQEGYGVGIFVLVATSVLREGTETVLYLKANSIAGATSDVTGVSNQLAGAVLGVVVAVGLGYALFRFAMGVNLRTVFTVTSVFLLLFAAGLVSHGVGEFQEAGLLPVFAFDPIVNISHILDHKSVVGSFLRTLFGYTSKPTILEITSYGSYIAFILWLERTTR